MVIIKRDNIFQAADQPPGLTAMLAFISTRPVLQTNGNIDNEVKNKSPIAMGMLCK